MLKHPYLLSFCILGAALGAMTYITRHPELWLERAHEAELRAACKRMDKALEKSVIEEEYLSFKGQGGEVIKSEGTIKKERNGEWLRGTYQYVEENENTTDIRLQNVLTNKFQRSGSGGTSWVYENSRQPGVVDVPIPYLGGQSFPFSYEIFKEMVNVEDRPCIVVRFYRDIDWYTDYFLDPGIGYMPRMVMRDRNKTEADDKNRNLYVTQYGDYREIATNVHLPFRTWRDSENNVYFSDNSYRFHKPLPPFGKGSIDASDSRILSVDLNPVFDEESFAFNDNIDETIDNEAVSVYGRDYGYSQAKGLYHRIGNLNRLFQ